MCLEVRLLLLLLYILLLVGTRSGVGNVSLVILLVLVVGVRVGGLVGVYLSGWVGG